MWVRRCRPQFTSSKIVRIPLYQPRWAQISGKNPNNQMRVSLQKITWGRVIPPRKEVREEMPSQLRLKTGEYLANEDLLLPIWAGKQCFAETKSKPQRDVRKLSIYIQGAAYFRNHYVRRYMSMKHTEQMIRWTYIRTIWDNMGQRF